MYEMFAWFCIVVVVLTLVFPTTYSCGVLLVLSVMLMF